MFYPNWENTLTCWKVWRIVIHVNQFDVQFDAFEHFLWHDHYLKIIKNSAFSHPKLSLPTVMMLPSDYRVKTGELKIN